MANNLTINVLSIALLSQFPFIKQKPIYQVSVDNKLLLNLIENLLNNPFQLVIVSFHIGNVLILVAAVVYQIESLITSRQYCTFIIQCAHSKTWTNANMAAFELIISLYSSKPWLSYPQHGVAMPLFVFRLWLKDFPKATGSPGIFLFDIVWGVLVEGSFWYPNTIFFFTLSDILGNLAVLKMKYCK